MESKKKIAEVEKIYKSFLTNAKYWISELDYYGPNQFKQKISETDWTIGQLYDHLTTGTYESHLQQIKNCILGVHGATQGKKTWKGKMIFFLGKIPAMKIKGRSSSDYVPAQPESPLKMKDDFYKFMKVMQKTAAEVENGRKDYVTLHPALGWLNVIEWYKLIEMHFRHHLIQKKRLDKTLRSTYKATPGEEIFTEV